MKINILGSDWTLELREKEDDPRLGDADGYTDDTVRLCVVGRFKDGDPLNKADLEGTYTEKVKRHELIHAFLYESGLGVCSDWAKNEEMVDWIATQFPKLLEAFRAAGALPENNDAAKTFTAEEVNEILRKRLARERETAGAM